MDKPTLGTSYQGYAKDGLDAAKVRALFVRKYGCEPAEVHDAKTCWLAGPVGGISQGLRFKPLDGAASEFPKVDQEPVQLDLWEGGA